MSDAPPMTTHDAGRGEAEIRSRFVVVDRYGNILRGYATEGSAKAHAMHEQRKEDRGERSADGPYRAIPLPAAPQVQVVALTAEERAFFEAALRFFSHGEGDPDMERVHDEFHDPVWAAFDAMQRAAPPPTGPEVAT